ncbi:hypothetical protein EBT31_00480 [bacterium]|nr:hypothetical protein [bacterium]
MAASINASTTAGVVTTADTSGVLNIQTANTTAISISASQVVSYTNNPTYSGGTANGVLYLNGSKVATSGSALTFDGTNFATTGNIDSGSAKNIALNATFSSDTNRLQWKYQGTAYAWIERDNSTGGMAFTVQSAEGMRLTSTGLGIGTSSPATKLNLENAGACQIQIAYNSTTYGRIGRTSGGNYEFASYENGASLTFGTSNSNGSTTTNMTLDRYGNLGLGVTPSVWNAGGKVVEIGATGLGIWGNSTANFMFVENAYYNSGWKYASTNGAAYYQMLTNSHAWYIAPSGTAGNAITFTQAMTLDASGNLGVGVTSPSVKLQVDGGSTPGTIGQFGNAQGGVILGAASSTAYVNTTSSSPLAFQINGTERARIDSSGNFQFNSGYGSVAIAYGCRVWVSYNTVTSTSIRGNGGVSSLTDNGTGDTTINFSVTMPDTNYSVVGATKLADSTTTTNNTMIVGPFSFGTTSVRIYTTRPGDSLNDCAIVNISIFR